MKTVKTPLDGLLVLQRNPFTDQRGSFCRLYCSDFFKDFGLNKPLAQINHSLTEKKHSLRGMHFQNSPFMEDKIISCLHGAVFDVAVDIRRHSPTFLHWHAEILSPENHKSLLIPQGFAHGFLSLEDKTELLYLHTESYHPEAEAALSYQDPRVNIQWPHKPVEISERDRSHKFIASDYQGVDL